jgi:hypothetical protein
MLSKQRFLIFFFLFMATSITAQNNNLSWYKAYKGMIGTIPFTLHLHKAGNDYAATAYYQSKQQPYFLAAMEQKTNQIELFGAPAGGSFDETWKIKINGTKLTGTFTLNKKATPITATEIKTDPATIYVYTEGVENLSAEKNSPTMTYFGSTISFSDNKNLDQWAMPYKSAGQSAGDFLLEEKKKYFESCKEELKDVKPADYAENTISYTRELVERTTITYTSKNLLVLSRSYYTYTGGAHGIHGSSYDVMDRKNNKKVALKDIITDTAALIAVLEKNFRMQYKVNSNETLEQSGLFSNSIAPNQNFILTSKSLCFNYVPYEIGPYAMGEITIYIPLADYKHLLTTYGKQLIIE